MKLKCWNMFKPWFTTTTKKQKYRQKQHKTSSATEVRSETFEILLFLMKNSKFLTNQSNECRMHLKFKTSSKVL